MSPFRKDQIAAQFVAFFLTASILAYFSKTIFGSIFALLMGLLSVLLVRLVIGDNPLAISLNSQIATKKTYNLLAVFYAIILLVLLIAASSGIASPSIAFFQEWGAISIQEYALLFASIAISFFLPGFFILRLIDSKYSVDGLATIVFSFILSVLFTPLVVILSLFFLGKISVIFYLLISMILLLVCAITHRVISKKIETEEMPFRFQLDLGLVIIVLSFLVAALAFSNGYGYSMGGDIWRHQGASISIIRYGFSSIIIPTNWYHVSLAFLLYSSGFPTVNFAPIFNLLNILPIIAFYCTAKKIFGESNKVGPFIASAFFALFSGFGWIYALYKLSFGSWSDALVQTSAVTANDTMFSNLWNWGNNPFVIGFASFLMLIYLLFGGIKGKKTVFVLTLLTFFTAWAVHVAEAYVFIIVFGVVLVFCGSIEQRLKINIFTALVVGLLATIPITLISQSNAFSIVGILESFLLLIYLLGSMGLTFALPRLLNSFRKFGPYIIQVSKIKLGFFLLILFLWLLSFNIWAKEISTLWLINGPLTDIGLVPWYVYPVRLGIVGLFAIAALFLKTNNHDNTNSKHSSIFALLAGVLIIFGVAITIAKLYYISVDFWEIRVLRYSLDAVVAILGATFAVYLFDLLKEKVIEVKQRWSPLSPKLLTAILLSIIVIAGTMSTLFAVDYSHASDRRSVAKDTSAAQLLLNENLPFADSTSLTLSISDSSADFLTRFGLKSVSNPMNNIASLSPSPEAYYFARWFTNASYLLYMPEFDSSTLLSNKDSFSYSNIISGQNPEYRTEGVSIYSLRVGAPPTPDSNTLLILPNDTNYGEILNAFAQSNVSYTTASSIALTNLNYSTVILPYDPTDSALSQKLLEKVDAGMNLVVFNIGSFGNIADKLNLVKKEQIAPIEPTEAWKIASGTGQIHSNITADNQTNIDVTGQTDASGVMRVDYLLPSSMDLSSAQSILFKVKSSQIVQSIRFALFDDDNNYQAYTLPYTSPSVWTDFNLGLSNFTETSPAMNISSISRIRIGLNSQPNSTTGFSFSGITAVFKAQNSSADSLSFKEATIALPSTTTVPVLNSANARAFYISNNTRVSPFLIEEGVGNGNLLYVNSLPLLAEKDAFPNVLTKVLPWVQELANIPQYSLTKDNASNRFEMYTKSIFAEGSVSVDSNSLISTSGFSFDIQEANCTDAQFSINATQLQITPSSQGTYSVITVYGTFDLTVTNGEQTPIIYRISNNCTFLVKDPHVTTNGDTRFEYSYWRKNTRDWGTAITFYGETSFNIYYSSTYLLLFDFNYKGNFNYVSAYPNIASSYPNLQQFEPTLYISIAFVVLIVVSSRVRKIRSLS